MTNLSSKRIGLNYESWLYALVDEASFKELCNRDDLSVFTGEALIKGKRVAIYGHNPKVDQGFVCSKGALEIAKLMDLALEAKIPLISLVASPGVSVKEGLLSGHEYTKVIVRNIKLSGVIPQISIVIGQSMGAPAYSATLTDYVLFNKSRSSLMVTGPSVIRQVIGEEVSIRELGGSEVHAQKTGIADFVDKDISMQIARARALVGFLPSSNHMLTHKRLSSRPRKLLPALPSNIKDTFEVSAFLQGLCDESEYMEFRPEFGQSILCAYCYIGGHAFAVIANKSNVNAGALDCDASFKAARFLRLCDSYNLPILNLIDVPGFMPGIDQEHDGLLKYGANLCQAMQTSSARFSVILRKCYGAAAFIMMQTRAQGGSYVFALEGARIAVMGHAGAKSMLGREMDEESYYNEYEAPRLSVELGIVDEIVSSEHLRDRLIVKIEEVLGQKSYQESFKNKRAHQIIA